MKGKHKPNFRAAIKEKTLELVIYDDITGPSPWGDYGISAKGIKKAIDEAGDFDGVRVRINSPGGDVFEGLAIYNLLRSLGKPIDVVVDGLAASSASIVAMAGDTITMGKNALMMIHNAWTGCVGYAAEIRKMADTLDKVSDSISLTYVNVTGKDQAVVKALMDAETWLSAEDAVAEGFATGIAEESREAVEACGGRLRAHVTAKAPKAFQSRLKALMGECGCDCPECVAGDCPECSHEGCEDENCTDCPMQSGVTASAADTSHSLTAELSLKERTLRLYDRLAGIKVSE